MEHRGASGADPETGDGAGHPAAGAGRVCCALLPRGARARAAAARPLRRRHGFLPRDPGLRLRCEELCVRICAEEGHRALGWRDVPVRSESHRRAGARCREPVMRQLLVERRGGRRRGVRAQAVRHPPPRRAGGRRRRRPEADVHDRLALRRARSSTRACSRPASWPRTTPICASPTSRRRWRSCTPASRPTRSARGISRTRSTSSPTTARSTRCAATRTGCPRASRSCAASCSATTSRSCSRSPRSAGPTRPSSTRCSSCWCSAGAALPHALAMLIPPAWSEPTLDLRRRRARVLRVPRLTGRAVGRPGRDLASDGVRVVATLDRNGLRPCRYVRTRDGLVVLASEVGVLEIDRVRDRRGRPAATRARCWSSTPTSGASWRRRGQARAGAAPAVPALARRGEAVPRRTSGRGQVEALSRRRARAASSARSATPQEELRLLIGPMARDGAEPVGSMGDDTPLAALSRAAAAAAGLLQAALRPGHEPAHRPAARGARDEPAHRRRRDRQPARRDARALPPHRDADSPVLPNGELREAARAATRRLPHGHALDAVPVAGRRRRRSSGRSTRSAAGGLAAGLGRTAILDPVRPRRRSESTRRSRRCSRPRPCTRTSCARARARCAAWWSSRASRARRCTSRCWSATAPRPSTRTWRSSRVRALRASGELGDADARARRERATSPASASGLLKVCSKMGISTDPELPRRADVRGDRARPADGRRATSPAPSRGVGGIELADLHDEIAERHRPPFAASRSGRRELDPGGEYRQRRARRAPRLGSRHDLEAAARGARRGSYDTFARVRRRARRRRPGCRRCAGCFELVAGGASRSRSTRSSPRPRS